MVRGIVNDLTGQRFGRLVVTAREGWFHPNASDRMPTWRCRCDCGAEKVATSKTLRQRAITSCGCVVREASANAKRRHGHAPYGEKSATYRSWLAMKGRCLNPKNSRYPSHGARGIRVCERWLDFANFLADMGERPKGTSIERKDNDGNYEPSNCRWATPREQSSNTRRNRWVLWQGERMTASEAGRRMGLKPRSIHNYVRGQTPPPPGLVIL